MSDRTWNIRPMETGDRSAFMALCHAFYQSDAIKAAPQQSLFDATFAEIMRRGPYLTGLALEAEGRMVGYAVLSRYFSPEMGGVVLWVDELFIDQAYRGRGAGKQLFKYVENNFAGGCAALRLEVERDNARAMALYAALGFESLDYVQLMKRVDTSPMDQSS